MSQVCCIYPGTRYATTYPVCTSAADSTPIGAASDGGAAAAAVGKPTFLSGWAWLSLWARPAKQAQGAGHTDCGFMSQKLTMHRLHQGLPRFVVHCCPQPGQRCRKVACASPYMTDSQNADTSAPWTAALLPAPLSPAILTCSAQHTWQTQQAQQRQEHTSMEACTYVGGCMRQSQVSLSTTNVVPLLL
jgi:hypothetical protein